MAIFQEQKGQPDVDYSIFRTVRRESSVVWYADLMVPCLRSATIRCSEGILAWIHPLSSFLPNSPKSTSFQAIFAQPHRIIQFRRPSIQATANATTGLIRAGVQFHATDSQRTRIPDVGLSFAQFKSAHFQSMTFMCANVSKAWLE